MKQRQEEGEKHGAALLMYCGKEENCCLMWGVRGTNRGRLLTEGYIEKQSPALKVKSSYSTLDVTLWYSPLRHYAAPPGPGRSLSDNYYSALTTDPAQAICSSSALSPSLCQCSFSRIPHMQVCGAQCCRE